MAINVIKVSEAHVLFLQGAVSDLGRNQRQIWELKAVKGLYTCVSTIFLCGQDHVSLPLEQCGVPDGPLYILAEWRDG